MSLNQTTAEAIKNVPQAVATILTATFGNMSRLDDGGEEVEKRVIELTEKLTRTMVKALTNT